MPLGDVNDKYKVMVLVVSAWDIFSEERKRERMKINIAIIENYCVIKLNYKVFIYIQISDLIIK